MTYDSFFHWWLENGSQDFDALLFDIDGTLISGGKALPGASETLDWLRSKRFPFRLITNDGNHSPEQKSGFLRNAGLQLGPEEIASCGHALAGLADSLGLKGAKVFVLGEMGTPDFAKRAGLVPCWNVDEIEECHAVVVSEGDYDWMKNITAALNYLARHPESVMIAPNPDTHWPDGKGGFGIGAGATARQLTMLLRELQQPNRKPIYLGKPYPAIYDYALDELAKHFKMPAPPRKERTLMIGDSLQSDIQGAHSYGMKSALLLTGITNAAQAEQAAGDRRPDFVFKRLG